MAQQVALWDPHVLDLCRWVPHHLYLLDIVVDAQPLEGANDGLGWGSRGEGGVGGEGRGKGGGTGFEGGGGRGVEGMGRGGERRREEEK